MDWRAQRKANVPVRDQVWFHHLLDVGDASLGRRLFYQNHSLSDRRIYGRYVVESDKVYVLSISLMKIILAGIQTHVWLEEEDVEPSRLFAEAWGSSLAREHTS